MTTYFHAASALLGVGSVIEPGNWGRIQGLYRHDGSPLGWRLAAELVLEATRLARHPHLPSRKTSCFAFPDMAAAVRTRYQLGNFNMLYEVELVDESLPKHTGDFDLVTRCFAPDTNVSFLDKVEMLAVEYWKQAGQAGTRELITASPLRVVRPVEWPGA